MLKRLELLGFKSFAEKTQFDFGAGLTAIVGPNGSGKSNIVDAIRWILGEQSAKSLRGGEMADVIFNGSSTRRSLGMAEVTLTLDNARRQFAIDADEVQVTRRVYRSGEGEYLINKQPSRLKDIKDMFLGSGAGTDAYSIIEQGRVDVLLQASTVERRAIFEEAAGISRFKAKKIETVRKLEHVEQNLLRLRDIMDEVERQLRSVKLQASKAERYREHMVRLKELRVALGLDECHGLSTQIQQTTAALEQLRTTLTTQTAEAARWEADLLRTEQLLAEQDTALHREEAGVAAAQQRIAAEETTLKHERVLTTDLETELTKTRHQLHEFGRQLATLAAAIDAAVQECEAAEHEVEESRDNVSGAEAGLAGTSSRLADLRRQVQVDKVELMEEMRRHARLHNEQVSLRAQADSLTQHRQRLLGKTTQATASLTELDVEVQALETEDARLQAQLAASRNAVADFRSNREELRKSVEHHGEQLGELRAQRSGLASRIQVLENLEKSHEGLDAGVREVLAHCTATTAGPWETVLGLVADFLTVDRQHAALVDIALGERSQFLLFRSQEQLSKALAALPPQAGRASFLAIPQPDVHPYGADSLPNHPGIIARASDLVTCSNPELVSLPRLLLGMTLIVKDLPVASELATSVLGFNYMTLAGELLTAEGVLTVGPHHAESGILSRKSELRELQRDAVALDLRILDAERQFAALRDRLAQLESRAQEAEQTAQVLVEQEADLRSRLTQVRQRHEGLSQEVELGQSELKQLDEELVTLEQACRTAEQDAGAIAQHVQALQERLEAADKDSQSLEQERQQRQGAATTAQVALATAEERFSGAERRQQQAERAWRDRQTEHSRQQEQVAQLIERLQQSQQTMLRATNILAHAYVEKEAGERQIRTLQCECDRLRAERQSQAEKVQSLRRELGEIQEQAHARELECSDLQHRLRALADRLKEEHDVDLLALYQGQAPDAAPALQAVSADQATAEQEIAELKKKIARLGSVNLDALQELEELEKRSRTLQTQHDDLTSAKKSLDEIIAKINQDSRKLFADSFQAIRTHFQELFRKLFGGGMADVILENENDILESGIEIIARPPGKELRSISLLSGGEKTLTAVALLLAIFRSKPSPFCVLDEVDAALDEANIGRFAAVLREFLDQSQFILITHSKKTMATADVLYGITMQEAGISKRVAIRLEDWPEDGQPATARNEEEDLGPPAERAENAA
jgi:chromosome segregation protein